MLPKWKKNRPHHNFFNFFFDFSVRSRPLGTQIYVSRGSWSAHLGMFVNWENDVRICRLWCELPKVNLTPPKKFWYPKTTWALGELSLYLLFTCWLTTLGDMFFRDLESTEHKKARSFNVSHPVAFLIRSDPYVLLICFAQLCLALLSFA